MTMYSLLYSCCLLITLVHTRPTEHNHTELIYQASKGVWFENLAVRADGSILTTVLTSPDLYLIQPSSKNPDPQLIHHFDDGSTSLLGITEEATRDVFQVVATNFSFESLSSIPNTSKVYRVDLSQGAQKAKIQLTANLPEVQTPDGLATLNDHIVLLTDSGKGTIVSIDTRTGAHGIVISDPLLQPNANFPAGVNGLKIFHHGPPNHHQPGKKADGRASATLYFTNSAQDIFASIEIDPETGSALTSPRIISHGLTSVPSHSSNSTNNSSHTEFYDDFTLTPDGQTAYLGTQAGNSIVKVDISTGKQSIVAGDVNSTEIAEPAAVAFGRKSGKETGVLYVTTAGGLGFPIIDADGKEVVVGGQIVAVDTNGAW